jgi:hypothetical protein
VGGVFFDALEEEPAPDDKVFYDTSSGEEDGIFEDGVANRTNDLDAVDRGERAKRATKADEAEVPEPLWREHLLEDEPPAWWAKGLNQEKVPQAMDSHCEFCLVWWKRNVTRTFGMWLRKLAKPWPDTLGQLMRWNEEEKKYEWAKDGRDSYQWWWQDRFAVHAKDLTAAADDVQRAADLTWWSWDAGSALFHW